MSRAWIFQANPQQYNIDRALETLDRIWWRVPQHTHEIHIGDVAVLWRSGRAAGIIGVGRIASEPQHRKTEDLEREFGHSPSRIRSSSQTSHLENKQLASDEGEDSTRALVLVRQTRFLPKDQLKNMPAFREHQIIRAPLGTVFPLSDPQWETLEDYVEAPPDLIDEPGNPLPLVFAWGQRAKASQSLPGGHDRYLNSLETICKLIIDEQPSPSNLALRLEEIWSLVPTGARLKESFLRKVGFVNSDDGVCKVGYWTERWLESHDDSIPIALLHSRIQFVGELLEIIREPRTADEILSIANSDFGMRWDTKAQIESRLGWLRSGGMISSTDDGRLLVTDLGRALLQQLVLYRPSPTSSDSHLTDNELAREIESLDLQPIPEVEQLLIELRQSSVDSHNPDRFEQATRDAFNYLGFQAQWLGGSGKTDVLLIAALGNVDTYRVIIDCKTSASGSVSDPQVDWATLDEHKSKYKAQYVGLVAPNPSGSRLTERAGKFQVTVISVDQLGGLCLQHSKTPLGLDEYRLLFESGGIVDTQQVAERAEDFTRIMELTSALCRVIRKRSETYGRLYARDLHLSLDGKPVAEGTTQAEIQQLLDVLSSPLLRVLDGSAEKGYLVTSSPDISKMRINILANHLAESDHDDSDGL